MDGLWTIPALKYPEELLAGLFDTDGCVRRRRKDGTTSVTREVLLYSRFPANLAIAAKLLVVFNIFPTLMHHHTTPTYVMHSLTISHWTQMMIFARSIPLRHQRKRELLEGSTPKYNVLRERMAEATA